MFGYASKLPISRFDADFTAILISYIFEFHTKRTDAFTPPLDQTLYKSNQMQQKTVQLAQPQSFNHFIFIKIFAQNIKNCCEVEDEPTLKIHQG